MSYGTFPIGRAAYGSSEASYSSGSTFKAYFLQVQELSEMLKNVASQRIGAQLVSASDGSAFTGSVTVAVTGDAGTQATGSVGSGACTHEGNGYHTYAPSQAETNYSLIAFTFTGTGAVPVTVQLYTRPTNDYASQDSVNTIDDFLDTEIAAIKAKTDNLPTDPADASDIAASFATVNGTLATLATAANLATVAGYLDTEIAAILEDTGTTIPAQIAALNNLSSAQVVSALGTGTWATAIPWNVNWDAEVQSECTDALNAYDPPTNSEFEARTILAASYATAVEVAKVIKTGEEFTATDGTGSKDVTFTRV